jgi:hypothetical protein
MSATIKICIHLQKKGTKDDGFQKNLKYSYRNLGVAITRHYELVQKLF